MTDKEEDKKDENKEEDLDKFTTTSGTIYRTREDAEASIALLKDQIEELQDSIKDDVESLKEEIAEIENLLDNFPEDDSPEE